jgi:hypothetical protein
VELDLGGLGGSVDRPCSACSSPRSLEGTFNVARHAQLQCGIAIVMIRQIARRIGHRSHNSTCMGRFAAAAEPVKAAIAGRADRYQPFAVTIARRFCLEATVLIADLDGCNRLFPTSSKPRAAGRDRSIVRRLWCDIERVGRAIRRYMAAVREADARTSNDLDGAGTSCRFFTENALICRPGQKWFCE